MKIRQMGVGLFHVDGRTDTTKLILAFSNFANAPKSSWSSNRTVGALVHTRTGDIPNTVLKYSYFKCITKRRSKLVHSISGKTNKWARNIVEMILTWQRKTNVLTEWLLSIPLFFHNEFYMYRPATDRFSSDKILLSHTCIHFIGME
jgi:hypothetical protein